MMAFLWGPGERPLGHGCNSIGRGTSVKSRVGVSRVLPAESRSTQHPGSRSLRLPGGGLGGAERGLGVGGEPAWGHQ